MEEKKRNVFNKKRLRNMGTVKRLRRGTHCPFSHRFFGRDDEFEADDGQTPLEGVS